MELEHCIVKIKNQNCKLSYKKDSKSHNVSIFYYDSVTYDLE